MVKDHHLNKHVSPCVPNVKYTKIQTQSFLGSREEDFFKCLFVCCCVFSIYGHGGHLVQWCGTISTVNIPSTEGSMSNLVKTG